MRVLVLGDLIVDKYRMCMATRLCPEGPVPVLVEEKSFESQGGAGLVANQLIELAGKESVVFIPGTISTKERVFADDRLMLRIDRDSPEPLDSKFYGRNIAAQLKSPPDAIIVSDYGKGSFTGALSRDIVRAADTLKIPVFVDAKNSWDAYWGCFAMFPNKTETNYHKLCGSMAKHVINKLGPDGCSVDGNPISTKNHPVRDTTGAGDCFLAAFVYKYLDTAPQFRTAQHDLEECARFANKVAGISVEFVGTHVVTRAELENN
jgi:D-beta-D-heptose 7-phosphate kinase/D-beta-D-heptose 1-phosphate adenosyltransferase